MSSPVRYEPMSQAPARREQPSIATLIKKLQPELARALPKHLDADRVARLALTVVRKTPKLARCTPESFAGALLTAASLGLEPGVNGEAWLIPYEDRKNGVVECQLIVGYQGVAKQYWQSPLARGLDVRAVHERDEFDFGYGLNPYLHHKPARGHRGEVTDYYAVAKLADSEPAFIVLSAEEVAELRRGKVGPNGDIPDPQHWMEKKTVLKQLLKILPKSTALHNVIDADERAGSSLYRDRLTDNGIIDVTPEPIEAIESEQPADTGHTAPANAGPAQKRALFAMLKAAGVTSRDARLAVTRRILGDDAPASFNDLTSSQATAMLNELGQLTSEQLAELHTEIRRDDPDAPMPADAGNPADLGGEPA